MARSLAVGLVQRPNGTSSADLTWARALVIRHARAAGLTLLDVFELSDDSRRNADELDRLSDLASTSAARALITDGVPPALVTRLIRDLGLRHEAVPARRERRRAEG